MLVCAIEIVFQELRTFTGTIIYMLYHFVNITNIHPKGPVDPVWYLGNVTRSFLIHDDI